MLSCTEFIPAYSELFKYIEKRDGHDAVVEYWNHISDTYVRDTLGQEMEKGDGLMGCYRYWSHSLNEEAADFTMTLDEENNDFSIVMHHCPSRGMLNELTYMEPYHDYCGHCAVLYSRVLKDEGIDSVDDQSEVDQAKCSSHHHMIDKK